MKLISLVNLFLDSGTQRYANFYDEAFPNHLARLLAPIDIASALPDTFSRVPGVQSTQVRLSNVTIDDGTEAPTVSQILNAEELLGKEARGRVYDLDTSTELLKIEGIITQVTSVTQTEAVFTITSEDDSDLQTLLPARRLLDVYPSAELNGLDERTAVGVVFGDCRKVTLAQVHEKDYIQADFTLTGGEPDKYLYVDLTDVADYTVSAGDTLIYEVQWDAADSKIALDLVASGTPALRNSGAVDQNGLNASPVTDLSAKTFDVPAWYRREITLPAGFAGKTIVQFSLGCENDTAATHVGRVGKAMIVNSAGVLQRTIIGENASTTGAVTVTSNAGNTFTFANNSNYIFGALRTPASGTLTIATVYRNGAVVAGSEWTEVTLLSAYRVVQFTTAQRDTRGNLPIIQVDLTCTEFSDNPATVIKFLREDANYGLGQTVEAASFTTAATAYDTASIEVASGLFVQEPWGDILPDLLLHGAYPGRNNSREHTLTVDESSLHTAGPFGLGQGDDTGWENFDPDDAAPLAITDRIATLHVYGVLDPGLNRSGEAWLVRSSRTRAQKGVEREVRLRFARNAATIDREAHYLWEQLTAQDTQLSGTVPITEPDAETLALNDLLTVTIPNLLISAVTYQLRGLAVRGGTMRLMLTGYDAAAYSYAAGTDQFIDPRALSLTDFSQTLPVAPTNFTNFAPVTSVNSNGVVETTVVLEADAPSSNVGSLRFRAVKQGLAASRDEAEVAVSPGDTDVQAALYLEPGLTYDFEVHAYNPQNDPGFQSGLVATITGVSTPSDADIPSNTPVPSGYAFDPNEDGSIDFQLTWNAYSQGAVPADHIALVWKVGAAPLSAPTLANRGLLLEISSTEYTFHGFNPNTNYRWGMAAARSVEGGGFAITAIQAPAIWQDKSETGDYTNTIDGTAATTVVANAANGQIGFDETVTYRTAGAPTNSIVPSSISPRVENDGSASYIFGWTYEQGAKQADLFHCFWRENGTPTAAFPHITVQTRQGGGALLYRLELTGFSQDTTVTFMVSAGRRTENGIEATALVGSPTAPQWEDVTTSTPDYDGTILGELPHTFRFGPPTNNPSAGGFSQTTSSVGNRIDNITWTYTQPTQDGVNKLADGFIVYVALGDTSNPQDQQFKVGIGVRNFEAEWPFDQPVSYGVASYRETQNGEEAGPLQTSVSGPDWQGRTGGTAITQPGLAVDSVGNPQIVNDAVTTLKILDASITDAKISNLSAAKITTGQLTVDPVSGGATAVIVKSGGSIEIQAHQASGGKIEFTDAASTLKSSIEAGSTTATDLDITGAVTDSGTLRLGGVGKSLKAHVYGTNEAILKAGRSTVQSGNVYLEGVGTTANRVYFKNFDEWRVSGAVLQGSGPSGSVVDSLKVTNLTGTVIGYIELKAWT